MAAGGGGDAGDLGERKSDPPPVDGVAVVPKSKKTLFLFTNEMYVTLADVLLAWRNAGKEHLEIALLSGVSEGKRLPPIHTYARVIFCLRDDQLAKCRVPESWASCNWGWFQTEHLSTEPSFRKRMEIFRTFLAANRPKWIVDFSRRNIEIMPRVFHGIDPLPPRHLVPTCDTMRIPPHLISDYERNVIVLVGSNSDRRYNIWSQLVLKHRCVIHVYGWGGVRDSILRRCGLVLNIHAYAEHRSFELIRCQRVLCAGIPVVTEDFDEAIDPELDTLDHLFIKPYDQLVDFVLALTREKSELFARDRAADAERGARVHKLMERKFHTWITTKFESE